MSSPSPGLKCFRKKETFAIRRIYHREQKSTINEVFCPEALRGEHFFVEKVLRVSPANKPQILSELEVNFLVLSSTLSQGVALVESYFFDKAAGRIHFYMRLWAQDLGALFPRLRSLPNSRAVARAVMFQSALALARLHELGVLHRDIKPGNILLGQGFEVALCDFGVSEWLRDRPIAAWKGMTRRYAAFEALGQPWVYRPGANRRETLKYDVFSLGLVFCELFLCLKGLGRRALGLDSDSRAGLREQYCGTFGFQKWAQRLRAARLGPR